MSDKIRIGDRVKVRSGSRAGHTGKVTRWHGGAGFAGYACLRMDGTEWDAPGFAAPVANLERLS